MPPDARVVSVDQGRGLRGRVGMDLAVRREVVGFRPNVLLAHGNEIPVDLVPTVGLLTDPLSGGGKWGRLSGVRSRLVCSRIAKMTMAVAPSESACRRIADLGIPRSSLRVAWPGVDTTELCPQERAGEGPLRLLYAARITPAKGQHVAIEAVKGLHDNVRRQVHLDIVGATEDPAYLAKLRRRAEGAPVSFHLDVPDISEWVRRSDIVLFPTVTEEAFGYSAVDGMAAGKPVIFSQVAAVLEVTNGIGIPVAPGDPKRLGEAIRSLVREPDKRAELGRRGRELVLERYAWDKAFARYEALLLEAAGH